MVAVFRIVDQIRRNDRPYAGVDHAAGYHSLELRGERFRGQRDCSQRLAQVPFEFEGKVVLDLGCNVGAMLHSLSRRIQTGYGVDVDPRCIEAAQRIQRLNDAKNLEFFTFDVEGQPLSVLRGRLPVARVDICLLLSLCGWLAHWRELVVDASRMAPHLLFESNGTEQQQQEQSAWLRRCYGQVQLLSETSADDFERSDRKLFLCSSPQVVESLGFTT
jgi:SAM-dependent methyltransferase